MDGHLVFCADSVLRFDSDTDGSTMLPLISILNVFDEKNPNPFRFLEYINHRVVVEEGVTLTKVFNAIDPWKQLLTSLLDRDIAAYIDEIKKPSEVKEDEKLDWIGIYRMIAVSRAFKHEDIDSFDDIQDFFNSEAIPTEKFDIDERVSASGFNIGVSERYSLSQGVHSIKNTPIYLIDNSTLVSFISKEKRLFDDSNEGVKKYKKNDFIVSETSFTLIEFLTAIFADGLFFYSPEAAQNQNDHLKEILEENQDLINAIKSDYKQDNDEEVVKIEVVANDNITEPEPEPETVSDENKVMKVVVVDGAFDSLVNHYQSEKDLWKHVKEKCKADGTALIRIGKIDEAVPPEERYFGFLVNEEDSVN